ncbi:MAG: nucleoside-diphosphate kinase [Candidatus Chromulinivorax sp.]|nr:nucleoside-diphosphate kinase [Candidatus Chromulinivorax sp.]
METTFAIIKPDAVAAKNAGKIIDMIEAAGFNVVAMEKINMTQEQAHELYKEHSARSFFGEMVDTMTASPIIIMALEKENAVLGWRDLMGATNPKDAAAGTVRALFGANIGANAAHGSDSLASAARELAIFFGDLN